MVPHVKGFHDVQASIAKAAMAAVRGEKTKAELAQQFDLHANQVQESHTIEKARNGMPVQSVDSAIRLPAEHSRR